MSKKTKYIILILSFLVICSILGSITAFSSFKPTITTSTTYPAYTIPELAKVADNIVYGKIKEKRGANVKRDTIVQGVNNTTVTETTYGIMPFSKKTTHMESFNYSEDVYTDVDIEIKNSLKLNGQPTSNKSLKQQSILPYKEEGGETDTVIYKSEDEEGIVSEGDEVIIFTNKAGYNWGPQSVLKVENGIVTDKNGTKYTINEIINIIKKNI